MINTSFILTMATQSKTYGLEFNRFKNKTFLALFNIIDETHTLAQIRHTKMFKQLPLVKSHCLILLS